MYMPVGGEVCDPHADGAADGHGVANKGCTLYPVPGVANEGCTLYPVPGVANEGCTLYPVPGVANKGCRPRRRMRRRGWRWRRCKALVGRQV